MRKILSGLLIGCLMISCVACGGKEGKTPDDSIKEQNQTVVNQEKPYEGNAAILPMQVSSSIDDKAEAMRQDILNTEDTLEAKGIVYYISPSGNDDNDGKTPETAWKTVTWLDTVEPGCTVLFERGGVYRGGFALITGCQYGAYGEGPKPAIYGSEQNYADASLWTVYDENIWQIYLPESIDIGNVIFDHGKKSGMRVFSATALNEDYTFLYANKTVYLYLSEGNPAEIHEDIELSDTEHIIRGNVGVSNVVIENLCVKYGAAHGFSFGQGSENITIRGCEIGYIGGGCPSGAERYGNGIEFWRDCSNITVENCWVYQCYDAGITHQSSADAVQKDIKIQSNLVEYCQYNLEFFNENGTTKNVSYTDNILRFAGYQVFDPKERRGSNSGACSLICLWWRENPSENFVISNNILDTSYGYLITGWYLNQDGRGAMVSGNTYIQQPQMATYFYDKDAFSIQPSVTKTEDDVLYIADSQANLEKGVKAIDDKPVAITFEK